MKTRKKQWSYGLWARQLGLKATASLSMVLNGRRNAGPEMVNKLSNYFSFKNEERRYFQYLVQLQKVRKDSELELLILERMRRIQPQGQFVQIDQDRIEAISNWHSYAIREMVRLEDFKEDEAWIVSRLRYEVTAADVRKSILAFLSLGLLARDSNGRLFQARGRYKSTEDIVSTALRQFHEQMLRHAITAMHTVPVDEREISSTTFTMDRADLPRAKQMIRDFRAEFARAFEKNVGNETYHMEFAFFPLTQKSEERSANETVH